ncbi:MAG: EamA family transporter [Tuberibacillus sp.]
MGYIYILGTIVFTVYGQLILKWRISHFEHWPENTLGKLLLLLRSILDPFILSGFIAAFIASLFWMLAMSKFQLSYAYPFMSLSFVLVFFLSAILFHEAVTWQKVVGLVLVIMGLWVSSQSR